MAHKIKPDTVRRGPGPCIVEYRCVIYLRLLRLPSHWRATRTRAKHRDWGSMPAVRPTIGSVWARAKSPWMASLALSAALVLLTVALDLIHGTYRHSVGDRIFGDVAIWLVGACVVRGVIFVLAMLDGRRRPL